MPILQLELNLWQQLTKAQQSPQAVDWQQLCLAFVIAQTPDKQRLAMAEISPRRAASTIGLASLWRESPLNRAPMKIPASRNTISSVFMDRWRPSILQALTH